MPLSILKYNNSISRIRIVIIIMRTSNIGRKSHTIPTYRKHTTLHRQDSATEIAFVELQIIIINEKWIPKLMDF